MCQRLISLFVTWYKQYWQSQSVMRFFFLGDRNWKEISYYGTYLYMGLEYSTVRTHQTQIEGDGVGGWLGVRIYDQECSTRTDFGGRSLWKRVLDRFVAPFVCSQLLVPQVPLAHLPVLLVDPEATPLQQPAHGQVEAVPRLGQDRDKTREYRRVLREWFANGIMRVNIQYILTNASCFVFCESSKNGTTAECTR